LSLAIIVVIK